MKKLATILTLLLLIMIKAEAQTCFTPVWTGNGLDQMNFYVTGATINGTSLAAGDQIGIFDGTYCVGKATFAAGAFVAIVASKDDPDTPVRDGFIVGNAITFIFSN